MKDHKINQNKILDGDELTQLQFLMDKYCERKKAVGHCNDLDCAYCNIGKAYDEIFSMSEDVQWDDELFLF